MREIIMSKVKKFQSKLKGIGAFVIDFDGTASEIDVCDVIMSSFTTGWEQIGSRHKSGHISHAEMNRQFLSQLKVSPQTIKDFLGRSHFLRSGFRDMLETASEIGVPVYIVSGGWDFYISQIFSNEVGSCEIQYPKRLDEIAYSGVSVISNLVTYDNGMWDINNSFPSSFMFSPCKKSVIKKIREQVEGNIVFVGDGSTDYDAAEVADIIFARESLAEYCQSKGIAYYDFNTFNEVMFDLGKMKAQDKGYIPLLRKMQREHFLSPNGTNIGSVKDTFNSALSASLTSQGNGPVFPRTKPVSSPKDIIEAAHLNYSLERDTLNHLSSMIPESLQGGVKGGHPLMVKNIIPTTSTIFLAAHFAASVYAQNGVTGEDSAEALNSELKVSAVLSDIAGYKKESAAGLFTFGGTATNMYGIKMGMAKCCPEHSKEGVSSDIYVVGSKASHYSHVTAADWLGIGQKNYIHVASNQDQSTDMEDLEAKCREILEAGGKLACIIGSGGTTSNMAIDNFSEIKDIRDRLVEEYSLSYFPHIHADSVIGWPYLFFKNYDFDTNSLGFSEKVQNRILRAVERISSVEFADSFGVDFHKTGYMPYNSSMVICKNKQDLKALGRDSDLMTPLFHNERIYNPGKISLETSRSSAVMLATWVTLQSLGQEGYQVLLGHAQEMAEEVRQILSVCQSYGLYECNQHGYGTDVLIRCYPPAIDVQKAFKADLEDDASLLVHSDYTSNFFKWLTEETHEFRDKIGISKTSAAFYTKSGKPVAALRVYIMSPYTTNETNEQLMNILLAAKVTFDGICHRTVTPQAELKLAV